MNDFKKWEKQFFGDHKLEDDILCILIKDIVSPFFTMDEMMGYYQHISTHRDFNLKLNFSGWDPNGVYSETFLHVCIQISLSELQQHYNPINKDFTLTEDFNVFVCFKLLNSLKEGQIQRQGLVGWLPMQSFEEVDSKINETSLQLILSLENKLFNYFLKTGKIFK